MEETLLKYFLGESSTQPSTITPINIDNKIISAHTMSPYYRTYVTPDNNYFIRYGGSPIQNTYNSIDVYDANALEDGTPLYEFNNLTINGHSFEIRALKQDEDGRFYGIGAYFGSGSLDEYYLILFNNFVQEGRCYIRKFYSNTTMGITDTVNNVVKKEGSADYYLLNTTNKIFHYKIDIQIGNSLEVYNYTQGGTITAGTFSYQFDITDDNLCLLECWANNDNTAVECKKLIIDTTKEIENSYTLESISYLTIPADSLKLYTVKDFNFYIVDTSYNTLNLEIVDIEGTGRAYSNWETLSSTSISCSINNNYLITWNTHNLTLYYFSLVNSSDLTEFANVSFTGSFGQPVIMQKFNLAYICGLGSTSTIVYSKNIFSPGYTSLDSGEKANFMIPQYLNILSKQNDDTSVIFSRDVSNRFLAGNQLTANFNVPNYMLNGNQIKRQDVNGQTNLVIESDNKSISKNRFESLNLNYIYNLYVVDNTNENNLVNQIGSNRIANSVWNELDYTNASCLKLRVTYDDLTQDVITLTASSISGTSYTFTQELTGNIIKIEYLSTDLQTVYATYRCNLTGTNTIEQTITVEEG